MMAQTKMCDVFGGTKDVQTYRVVVSAGNLDPVIDRQIDLGPRGLERLRKFVERGVSKPEGKVDGNG